MKKKNKTLRTAETPVKEEKKKSEKNKTGAFIRLILGLLILLLGLWLWTRTLGTMLLFTNVAIGRVSRYWFIPVIIGAVGILTAVISFARKPKREAESMEPQIPAEPEAAGDDFQTPAAAEPGAGDSKPQKLTDAEAGAIEQQETTEAETADPEPQSVPEAKND